MVERGSTPRLAASACGDFCIYLDSYLTMRLTL